MEAITRRWLEAQEACEPDYSRALAELGDRIPVSRENFEHARRLGLNLLWLGCHMLDAMGRRQFVAFTLGQRLPALERMMGMMPAPEATALREAAAEAWRLWSEREDIRARSLAVALREMARDLEMRKPTPGQAEEAAVAAQRAISYAGMSPDGAKAAQENWLADRLIPCPA